MRPGTPPMTNIHRQLSPAWLMTTTASSAVSTAPTWYPVMMVVAALDALPLRAYSVTRVIAVGRHPPRPRPARKRNVPNITREVANAHARVNREKMNAAMIMTLRRPR